ncbi:MAG: hypothetical protein QM769_12330 [Pseudoxanthomonas sp.]
MDVRRFLSRTMRLKKIPAGLANPPQRGGRAVGACFLLLTFLSHKQRKVSCAPARNTFAVALKKTTAGR